MASSSLPVTSVSSNDGVDSRVQTTIETVHWDALSSLACKLLQVDSSHWGDHLSGARNLVRFLHLHDADNTILVARVPLKLEDVTAPYDHRISQQIASEVATMQYVESHTNIPVPHIHHHSPTAEGSVGSPYILMSYADGVPLSTIWEKMDDEKRRDVLRQAVHILLELWSHRFDKKGVLFRRGTDSWSVESLPSSDPNNTKSGDNLVTTSYSHAADYWLAYANAELCANYENNFGSRNKPARLAHLWFIRSLIPALFDPSLDLHGCPLTPGDFHSQNIMVIDADTKPRITSIIDWEFTGPDFVSSFAQYPFFIVDHPIWDEDHPLRERNVRDQVTFIELLREAEGTRVDAVGGEKLSQLISKSLGIYLFQQVICFPIMIQALYKPLFAYVFGADAEEDLSVEYHMGLMEGILKETDEKFNREREAWLEAREVLGDDRVGPNLDRDEFKALALKHLDSFSNSGSVRNWLASVGSD